MCMIKSCGTNVFLFIHADATARYADAEVASVETLHKSLSTINIAEIISVNNLNACYSDANCSQLIY